MGNFAAGNSRSERFIPTIPVKDNVLKEIDRINKIAEPVERALEYFAYACKQQLFWDGN